MNPCPNPACEGTEDVIDFEICALNTRTVYGSVECEWCGMKGPVGGSEDEAVLLWNNLPRKRKKKAA